MNVQQTSLPWDRICNPQGSRYVRQHLARRVTRFRKPNPRMRRSRFRSLPSGSSHHQSPKDGVRVRPVPGLQSGRPHRSLSPSARECGRRRWKRLSAYSSSSQRKSWPHSRRPKLKNPDDDCFETIDEVQKPGHGRALTTRFSPHRKWRYGPYSSPVRVDSPVGHGAICRHRTAVRRDQSGSTLIFDTGAQGRPLRPWALASLSRSRPNPRTGFRQSASDMAPSPPSIA